MAHDAASGVTGVDHEFGAVHNGRVIVAGVIGGNDHTVVAGERLWGDGHGLHIFVVVMAHFVELGEVRIVIVEVRATLLEQFHDFQGGRFTQIVDILFVGDAEDKQFRALRTFLVIVERRGDGVDNVIRHGGVHFAGQFDEAG